MSARLRKFIGLLGIVAFVTGYAVLASKIADHLPDNIAVQLIFYLVVGLAWGVPIFPLIRWMNSGR
jgi:small-conductance mechanosensitive channel